MIGTRFELTKVGKTCDDISKDKVKSFNECEEAAHDLSTGMRHWYHGCRFGACGCKYYNGEVWWISPDSHGGSPQAQEICRNGGKYNTLYCIKA